MNDAELAALRIAASKALGKAINHIEQTELETLRASREFEAKITQSEKEREFRDQRPRLFN